MATTETTMTGIRSIHHQRRWYYVLWCGLLLASLVALGLWELPVQSGTADLTVRFQITDAPPGCTARLWAGPRDRWPAADRDPVMQQAGTPLTAEGLVVGSARLRVGYRRWIGGVLPRRTDDLLVVKFQPKAGAPRYISMPLGMDWHTRLLRPGQRMGLAATISWDGLWLEPGLVPKSN